MNVAVQQAHSAASQTITSSYQPIPSKGYPRNETQELSRMGFARDLFDKGTSLRFGSMAETVCDRIGLPESVGDIAGIAVALGTGNYIEVTEHVADLVGDIAERNGNEKLANFCTAYEDKVGKFNQVFGKTAFLVASTIATAGAGGVIGAGAMGATGGAAGAGAAGSAGVFSAGGATVTVAQVFQGVKLLDGALRVGENLEAGDKQGAALGALKTLGALGGMGEVFGMAPETCEGLVQLSEKGGMALGLLASAQSEDGSVNTKGLAGALISLGMSQLGGGEDEAALGSGLSFLGGAISASGSPQEREGVEALLGLLNQLAASSAGAEVDAQHMSMIRI